jgi:hypothetical protein
VGVVGAGRDGAIHLVAETGDVIGVDEGEEVGSRPAERARREAEQILELGTPRHLLGDEVAHPAAEPRTAHGEAQRAVVDHLGRGETFCGVVSHRAPLLSRRAV